MSLKLMNKGLTRLISLELKDIFKNIMRHMKYHAQ